MTGFGGSSNKRKAINFSALELNDEGERFSGGGSVSETDSESLRYERPFPGESTSARRATSEDYGSKRRSEAGDERGRGWDRDGDTSKRGSSTMSGRGGWQGSSSDAWKSQGTWSDSGRSWQGSEAGSKWKKSNDFV